MGIRFRKTFPLGSLLRVNLSKSGVSLGIGPRGLNVNIGPNGIRRTVGIPGTGLSYQDRSSWPKSVDQTDANAQAVPAAGGNGVSWFTVLIMVIGVVVLLRLCSAASDINGSGPEKSSASPGTQGKDGSSPHATATPTQPSPKDNKPLSKDQVRELQQLLSRGGFKPGPADGLIGPATRAAVKAFDARHGVVSSAEPTTSTLERVRSQFAHGVTR